MQQNIVMSESILTVIVLRQHLMNMAKMTQCSCKTRYCERQSFSLI